MGEFSSLWCACIVVTGGAIISQDTEANKHHTHYKTDLCARSKQDELPLVNPSSCIIIDLCGIARVVDMGSSSRLQAEASSTASAAAMHLGWSVKLQHLYLQQNIQSVDL